MSLKLVEMNYPTDSSVLSGLLRSKNIPVPNSLSNAPNLAFTSHEALGAVADHADIKNAFPCTYGRARISLQNSVKSETNKPIKMACVLSGGQAPGGHNVIAGIYDYIKKISESSVMFAFLDGPQGIYNGQYCIIDDNMMQNYRNTGGFDMIGSGRHKIEKPIEFQNSMAVCTALDLDGLIVIGGDDSNTNAAVLAEYFEANNCKTKVCGAPKTIDGDLKVDPYIPISFGFDTACRTYSELIGNLGQDTLSSQKYYHFVRLMGRAASNIALECALQTRPNICLISEEIEQKQLTLLQITNDIVNVILKRNKDGKDYGIVVLPEGLIEFIPEFNSLIKEINDILANGVEPTEAGVKNLLSTNNQAVFSYLPDNIKQQLLLDRDPHGNVQVAKIETERLLAQTVSNELLKLKLSGEYKGDFMPQFHSFGYEGRSGFPSMFDSTYCYVLGQTVAAMIHLGHNGMIASVTNLHKPVADWQCGGVPITMMCHMEKRHGHMKAVIKKALVELDGKPFKAFAEQRDYWAIYDLYRSPGPIQFFGDHSSVELCITLNLELLGSDERLNMDNLRAAMAIQDKKMHFGIFNHSVLSTPLSKNILSDLQRQRLLYKPLLCPALSSNPVCIPLAGTQCKRSIDRVVLEKEFPITYGSNLVSIVASTTTESEFKPINIGVVFTGRQAPGGHDILSGLFDSIGPNSKLIGFVGGSEGLLRNHSVVLTASEIDAYRGQGGFELLARSQDSFKNDDFALILSTCVSNNLSGLVLIGGARTSSNAAYLAEYFANNKCPTNIITVPVDISGSLKDEFVETTVGFDTATKVACQVVGNNATDGASAKKYYYFMRLMGQEPSHSALEVALVTKPNFVILAEEVETRHMTLADIVRAIADVVEKRAKQKKNYGTVLIPEGLIDCIPELKLLGSELDVAFSEVGSAATIDTALIRSKLTIWSRALLDSLPEFMQAELLLSRGSENKTLLSQAETERMLAHFVDIELGYRKKKGTYTGSFSVVCSFIGYQARGALPSNFDVNYAYNLGFAAISLIKSGYNGYMAVINQLKQPVNEWKAHGVPLTAFLTLSNNLERSGDLGKASIKKAKVDVNGPAYSKLVEVKNNVASSTTDLYANAGPLQYFGPTELTNSVPCTIALESSDYYKDYDALKQALLHIEGSCKIGCSPSLLHIATKSLCNLQEIIEAFNAATDK